MTRHKHYDVIVAFAKGKQIQFKDEAMVAWEDWPHSYAPAFFNSSDYRVKPETLRYRVALCKESDDVLWTITIDNNRQGTDVESASYFVRWLTDWVEVEV